MENQILDIDALMWALDNDANLHLMDLDTKKLNEMNLRILQELDLTDQQLIDFYTKLQGFKYIDDLTDLRPGTYLRWISLEDNDVNLSKGACFCRSVFTNEGTKIVLKSFLKGRVRYITLNFDDYQFFYKLTNEERVVLSALDHLHSEDS